ncbi:MAG: hypothetical protein Q4A46_07250 [Clostridia bacterium]|nr:hypothetical protein [Clostridia bacterium]
MKLNSAYVVRDVFGKMILIPFLNTKLGNKPIYINETGKNIILMLSQACDENELCKKVAALYAASEGSNEYKLIQDFVHSLVELEIVEKEVN